MIEVVRATEEHLPEVLEVWKELMDFHRERDPHFTRASDGHLGFRRHLEECLHSQKTQLLVALDGGEVVAYSLSSVSQYPPVFEQRPYGTVSDLAVRKDYRRKGIGGSLVVEIKKWFKQKGLTRAEIRAASTNEVACSFWVKQGFVPYMQVMYREL